MFEFRFFYVCFFIVLQQNATLNNIQFTILAEITDVIKAPTHWKMEPYVND